MASLFLGTCAAATERSLHSGWLVLTVAGILAIEVAKNASGEIFDFDSGTDLAVAPDDRSPFSGGKRVLVDGLLTRGETIAISAVAYVAGIGAGLWIVAARAPGILWIGIAGVACAYLYHAPPFKLSSRGWGEFAVVICYGPLIAVGAYLVQRGRVAPDVWLVSLPLGPLVGAFLWINEFPDYAADRASGKRTWVVRLGRMRASRVFGVILAAAFGLLAILPLFGVKRMVWLGFIAALPAAVAARTLWVNPEETRRIVPAQALTLLAFLLFAVATGVSLLVH